MGSADYHDHRHNYNCKGAPPAPIGEGGPHDAFNMSMVKIREEAEDEDRQTINFNNTLVFTLPMFKSDRVTHKKSHLFNLVREQSCPTSGWKHQMHDVLIFYILLIMISIPYYVIHDLHPINLKIFHSHRIFWGGMRVAKVWVLGIRGLLPAR